MADGPTLVAPTELAGPSAAAAVEAWVCESRIVLEPQFSETQLNTKKIPEKYRYINAKTKRSANPVYFNNDGRKSVIYRGQEKS